MSTKPISPYYQDSILEITKLKAELESLRQENSRLREAVTNAERNTYEDSKLITKMHGENNRLREALEKIAYSPHCNYSSQSGDQYGMGVVDGHRCAAMTAREALNPPNKR